MRKLLGPALIFFAGPLALSGCFSMEPKENAIMRRLGGPADPLRLVLAVPTKDDLSLINGIQFSLTAFGAVAEEMNARDFDSIYWVGTAAIALQNDFLFRGRELPSRLAIDAARYALGDLVRPNGEKNLIEVYGHSMNIPDPAQARRALEALIRASTIIRNEQLITHLRSTGLR